MGKASSNPGLNYLRGSIKPISSEVSVLFTSRSSAGAWQIRGEQIAHMRDNWKARNKPSNNELEACDILCVVKKPDLKLIEKARRLGKIVIYDIVDSWAQPKDDEKYQTKQAAIDLFSKMWSGINADGYIFPTQRMQDELGFLVENAITIYHHHWPQISINPVRPEVKRFGYEGADYLGNWGPIFNAVAAERNIEFITNPDCISDLDVVVLARGGSHGSYLSRNYKSNVKLANALASGTPALVHYDEMSAHDTDAGDVLFFNDSPDSFARQLDKLKNDYQMRREIHRNFLKNAQKFSISSIANSYDDYFTWILAQARSKK